MATPRRFSPRLQNIPEEKRPYYGPEHKRTHNGEDEDSVVTPKKTKLNNYEKPSRVKDKGDEIDVGSDVDPNAGGETTILHAKEDKKRLVTSSSSIDDEGIDFVERKEVDRIKEAKNCRAGDDNVKRPLERPDLKAMKKMLEDKTVLYPKMRSSHLPGIKVGHQFFSWTEMVAVGIQGRWLGGICYIGKIEGERCLEEINNISTLSADNKMKPIVESDSADTIKLMSKGINIAKDFKDSGYKFPVAVAIVLSGQYEDDVDNSEEIIYTDQGGEDFLGGKRQIKNQVMENGNLALKNNMKLSLPLRVIRGNKCLNSIAERVYTYDGLYKVVEYWAAEGVSGFTVFKYRLKRLPGQPELVTSQVHFVRGKGGQARSETRGLVCEDISYGRENVPIPVTNIIDDSPEAPEGFTYINSLEVASNIKIPPSARGCCCKNKCTNPRTCSCAKRNPDGFPYVIKNGGRLVEPMDVVFECGPYCGCGPKCVNRTSQHGLKYRLEVYKTADKGWAVRSRDYIPSGAPVCEYIGVVRRTAELENVTGNDYIFEIDCLQTINEIGGRERRFRDVSLPSNSGGKRGKKSENGPEFCIDAGSRGNVARFINHSCEPNLFVQCVLSSHHDLTLARVVLFAADNIPPLQELTYDYGFELDSIVGPDGKIRKLACHCGTADCRKRLH